MCINYHLDRIFSDHMSLALIGFLLIWVPCSVYLSIVQFDDSVYLILVIL